MCNNTTTGNVQRAPPTRGLAASPGYPQLQNGIFRLGRFGMAQTDHRRKHQRSLKDKLWLSAQNWTSFQSADSFPRRMGGAHCTDLLVRDTPQLEGVILKGLHENFGWRL
jgi:hypothetical protein